MQKLKVEDLYRIKGEVSRSSALDTERRRVCITVHMGTCGISSGAEKVLKALRDELDASGRRDISITTSGCAGICNREPLITVERVGEEPIKYAEIDEERARQIFQIHVIKGEIIKEWAFARGWEQEERGFEGPPSPKTDGIPHIKEIPFFGMQELRVMRNRGLTQAERIEEYIDHR